MALQTYAIKKIVKPDQDTVIKLSYYRKFLQHKAEYEATLERLENAENPDAKNILKKAARSQRLDLIECYTLALAS